MGGPGENTLRCSDGGILRGDYSEKQELPCDCKKCGAYENYKVTVDFSILRYGIGSILYVYLITNE